MVFYFIYAGIHVLNMLYNYIPKAKRVGTGSKKGEYVRRYCTRISRQGGLPAIIILLIKCFRVRRDGLISAGSSVLFHFSSVFLVRTIKFILL